MGVHMGTVDPPKAFGLLGDQKYRLRSACAIETISNASYQSRKGTSQSIRIRCAAKGHSQPDRYHRNDQRVLDYLRAFFLMDEVADGCVDGFDNLTHLKTSLKK
jgi:hypothetical protein